MLGRCVAVVVRFPASTRFQNTSAVSKRLTIQCLRKPVPRAFSAYSRRFDASATTNTSTTETTGGKASTGGRTRVKPKRAASTKTAKKARPTKKSKSKSKAKSTKKKKPAAKKPVKKRLSPEDAAAQRARIKAKKESSKIIELKKLALHPPPSSKKPVSSWQAFFGQEIKATAGMRDMSRKDRAQQQQSASLEAGRKFQEIKEDPTQLDHWAQIAREMTQAKQTEYKKWVSSKTTEELLTANDARAKLRRKLKSPNAKSRWADIKDERVAIKRPSSAFTIFTKEMYGSGQITGAPIEASGELKQRWEELPDAEKEKYLDEAKEARAQYVEDYKRLHGRAPGQKAKTT